MADGLERQLALLGKQIKPPTTEYDTIALVGAAPASIGAAPDGLGVFQKRPEKLRVNGVPSYSLVGSGSEETVMWRASGGAWLVGSAKEAGSSNGKIRAKDSTERATPDSIES